MATDVGSILKFGLVGAAGYLAYRYFLAEQAPVAVVNGKPAGNGGGNGATAGFSSLASIFGRLTARAVREGLTNASPDEWNVLYIAEGGPGPAPDPIAVFGNRDPMSLATYWAGMSAWLAANKGLTGLGVYSGLYRLAGGGRVR